MDIKKILDSIFEHIKTQENNVQINNFIINVNGTSTEITLPSQQTQQEPVPTQKQDPSSMPLPTIQEPKKIDSTITKHYEKYENKINYKKFDYNNIPDGILDFFRAHFIQKFRILVTSTQYPGYGGAATNSYNLIKYIRQMGISCAGLFHESSKKLEELNGNKDPNNIGGIWNIERLYHPKRKTLNDVQKSVIEKIQNEINDYLGGEPTVILCKNYVSPLECQIIYPNSYILYLVSGSIHASEESKNKNSIQKFLYNLDLNKVNFETVAIQKENEANKISFWIATVSKFTLFKSRLYKNF